MNAHMHAAPAHGPFSVLAAMTHTRLELAGLELEAQLLASIGALMTAVVAIVLGLIALVFVGVAVITVFWDTHRVAAASGVTLACLLLAATIALYARARWQARPAPFASTLHQLELDREAMRDLGKAMS